MRTERLKRLQKAFPERRPVPARFLAAQLGWSLPTIYRGLAQLADAGAVIATQREGRSLPGPTPKLFIMMKEANL